MKILTNIQTSHLAGIGQAFWSFLKYLDSQKKNKVKIVGVKVDSDPNTITKGISYEKTGENFSLVSIDGSNLPKFKEVIKEVDSVDKIKELYGYLIDEYGKIIKKESPDLILINGTYYIPWSLFMATKATKIPAVLHYHGILTKEVAHWEDKPRLLMESLEKTFDNDRLFYLFPSELAKRTVEKEVFNHKINRSAIIPNSVPSYFFKAKGMGMKKNVGFIGRWSEVKNPDFIKKLARYNHNQGDKFKINVITDLSSSKKKLSKTLSLIKFLKPMDNFKLMNFYEKMGVILSPSHFETYGNVPQEAVAAGIPALVNNNMGVAETFKKLGLNDWIIDFSSTKEVYQKIDEFSGSVVPRGIREQLKEMVSGEKISLQMLSTLINI